MRKILTSIMLFFCICLTLTSCGNRSEGGQMEYQGKAYVPVTFSQDIFSCGFGMSGEFETDVTYPIEGTQFDMIHNSGDLYVVEGQAGEAAAYYQDDANYDWSVSIFAEDEPEDPVYPIAITDAELTHIYELENQEKDLTLFFDDIEQQATLIKTSKDGIARGSIELALYEGQWYWRSAVIDENQEKDGTWPEYVYPMPESFQDKVKR